MIYLSCLGNAATLFCREALENDLVTTYPSRTTCSSIIPLFCHSGTDSLNCTDTNSTGDTIISKLAML